MTGIGAPTGTKTSSEDEGELGNLPNPDALKSIQTTKSQAGTSGDQQVSLITPLTSLLPESPQSKSAISVGLISPPIPAKLAKKLQELLPSCLGAPGPTILDALLQPDKTKNKKTITSIQEWIVCFDTFISVVAMRNPNQVRDLLAYSSIIVKASQDFEGTPWLEYDIHFRRQVATQTGQRWEVIDASLWSMYFARATAKPGPMGMSVERKSPDPANHLRIPSTFQKQRAAVAAVLLHCTCLNIHASCQTTPEPKVWEFSWKQVS